MMSQSFKKWAIFLFPNTLFLQAQSHIQCYYTCATSKLSMCIYPVAKTHSYLFIYLLLYIFI